jgi:ribonuclease Z
MSVLRLVVLGSTAALPSKESLPSCFAVKFGATYLFDACEAVQQQLMKYGGGGSINAIFITHLHADHILGVPGLLASMSLAKRSTPMLIVGPKGTKEFFSKLLALKSFTPGFPVVVKETTRSGIVFKNNLFTVKAFPVTHGTPAVGYALETLPYRRFDEAKAKAAGIHGGLFTVLQEKGAVFVPTGPQGKGKRKVLLKDVTYVQKGKKIVFSGDTSPCAQVKRAAMGAELLVHEATFATDHQQAAKEKHHSTAGQAAQIALAAKVKLLMITHFSNRYEDRTPLIEEAKSVFPNTIMAKDGMEVLV